MFLSIHNNQALVLAVLLEAGVDVTQKDFLVGSVKSGVRLQLMACRARRRCTRSLSGALRTCAALLSPRTCRGDIEVAAFIVEYAPQAMHIQVRRRLPSRYVRRCRTDSDERRCTLQQCTAESRLSVLQQFLHGPDRC